MYQHLKSKLSWNPVTIRFVWVMLLAFCVVFWYYYFKLLDFTVKLATALIFS